MSEPTSTPIPPAGDFDLAGKVAVVTGGASGIGAAVATALRAHGAVAVAWDLLSESDVHCDVTDSDSVNEAFRATQVRFGTPTILIANAGIRGAGRIIDLDVSEWDATFAVNARGVFLTVQAVVRGMVEAGLPGAIVITGSVNGVISDPGIAAYSASKAAVMHFAQVAARELGEFGIRVNAIGPGPTDTPMMSDTKAIAGYRAEIAANTPLGKMGAPEDVAQAVIGLLKMTWVTGQALLVDGGSSLSTARGASIAARGRSK
jgi:NAD(P)-dependent dehydrogenase (short-subunit alcohol dehydrogenase family)